LQKLAGRPINAAKALLTPYRPRVYLFVKRSETRRTKMIFSERYCDYGSRAYSAFVDSSEERYIDGEGPPFSYPRHTLFCELGWRGRVSIAFGLPIHKLDTHITWEEFIERYTYAESIQECFEGDDPVDIPKREDLVGKVAEYWEGVSVDKAGQ